MELYRNATNLASHVKRVANSRFLRSGRGEGNLKAIQGVVLREIAGEHLLIPTGQVALQIHGMINLSESGLVLWNKLQSDCTEQELVNTLLAEYDVDRETAAADVHAFVAQMTKVGLLCESDEESK